MSFLNSILSWVMKKRIHQIDLFLKYPIDVQSEILKKLITTAKDTEFGKKNDFASINSLKEYQDRVPVNTYEEIYPYIERIMKGEQNILWPSEIKWFAKSSGTTNARSKFIPVSEESLEDCHYKGGKDLISIYMNNYPDSEMFSGKGLAIGGSHQINQFDPEANSYYGDVSAVILQNLPFWARWVRTPSLDIALMEKWEFFGIEKPFDTCDAGNQGIPILWGEAKSYDLSPTSNRESLGWYHCLVKDPAEEAVVSAEGKHTT